MLWVNAGAVRWCLYVYEVWVWGRKCKCVHCRTHSIGRYVDYGRYIEVKLFTGFDWKRVCLVRPATWDRYHLIRVWPFLWTPMSQQPQAFLFIDASLSVKRKLMSIIGIFLFQVQNMRLKISEKSNNINGPYNL